MPGFPRLKPARGRQRAETLKSTETTVRIGVKVRPAETEKVFRDGMYVKFRARVVVPVNISPGAEAHDYFLLFAARRPRGYPGRAVSKPLRLPAWDTAVHLHWSGMIPTLTWTPEGVRFIDQTRLPLEESYVLATTYEQVAEVIVTIVVRGAPAIGVSAAYGIALGALRTTAQTTNLFAFEFDTICTRLASTRPTAVNLFWAIDRMKSLFAELLAEGATLGQVKERILAEAHAMYEEDIAN